MFRNVFHNKTILVTGHTGFKGSWLSVWLHQLGARVHGLSDRVTTVPSMFEALKLDEVVDHRLIDVRNLEAVVDLVDQLQPDYVFHLAAQALVFDAYADPVDTFSTNVMGTAHLLEAVRKANRPCNVVAITSDKCYENVEWVWGYRENDALGGKDPYSASKACAEHVIHAYQKSYFSAKDSPVRLVSCRAGNVIGGGDWSANRIVPDCIKAWSKNQSVPIRRPQSTRPWQHVLEPLSGYLRVAQLLTTRPELNGESYNFGPPANQDYPVIELIEEIKKYWFPTPPNFEPVDLKPDESRPEAGLLKLSCDKALAALRWLPTMNFQQTAALTAKWYLEFYRGNPEMMEFTRQQITHFTDLAKSKQAEWCAL